MSTVLKGRPKSEEKKQQIFHAAVHLFLENGFDGTSMDEVAERAGVSKQTVYSHFQNKEELFSHCISHKCDCYGLSPELLDDDRPCADVLRATAHKFSELLLSPEALRVKRICCANAETQPTLSALFFEAGPKAMIDLLSDYLTRQSSSGRLEIDDPGTAARQFLYMIHGEPHMRALLNVPDPTPAAEVKRYVDSCVDLFLKAYGGVH
jgi:AcrR family transcriptional regulator